MLRTLSLLFAVLPTVVFAQSANVETTPESGAEAPRSWALSVGAGAGGLAAMPWASGVGLFYVPGSALGVTLERRVTGGVSVFVAGSLQYSSMAAADQAASRSSGGRIGVGSRIAFVRLRDDVRLLADVRARVGATHSESSFLGATASVDARSYSASVGLDAEYALNDAFGVRIGASLFEAGVSVLSSPGFPQTVAFDLNGGVTPYAEVVMRF